MKSDAFDFMSTNMSPQPFNIQLNTKTYESPEIFKCSKPHNQNTPSTRIESINSEFVLLNDHDEPFQVPFYKMEAKTLLKEIFKYFIQGLAMAFTHCSNNIIGYFCYLYIMYLKTHNTQVSFGLGMSYYNFAFGSLNYASFEVTGIQTSKYFGKKNYKMMSVSLVQGQIMQTYLIVFAIFLFLFSQSILTGLGIPLDDAHRTSKLLKQLIPGIIIQGLNYQLMAFCNSQGIYQIFGISSLISTTVGCLCCHWFFYSFDEDMLVFPYCKLITETINLIFVMYAIVFQADRDTLHFVRFKDIKKGFWEFMHLGMKISLSLFTMFLGCEFNTYLTGTLHKINSMVAWVSWLNITGFLYSQGLGASNVTRTRVGNYIGEGKFIQAKNYSNFSILISSIFGLIISILLLAFNNTITHIYSDEYDERQQLSSILYIYVIGAYCSVVIGIFNTLMRLTEKAYQDVVVMVSGFFILSPFLSYSLGSYFEMGINGIMLSFVTNITFCIVIFFTQMQKTKWNDLRTDLA